MTTIFNIPCGSHSVRTSVTSEPAAAQRWVRDIRQYRYYRQGRLLVGLSVQCVSRHAATLQLCVGSNCLIFQLHRTDHCPDALRSFLVDPNVILVALWDNAAAALLKASPHAVEVGPLVDVRMVAHQLRGCDRGATMGQLAEEILGIPGMSKDEAVGCSDWEVEELTVEQLQYACHDVFLPFLMAIEFHLWEWIYHY
ncbi:uncharacterized protein LOC121786929 [Salvia splendens]|uniref:uncharacterized protein LOC121786929 n=1 Tax=Salvia splendens TaxID=180675 RepID=UPI001C255DF0|nr:uncharacterized protein LOC121786929 [Salvia splendens]